MHDPTSIADTCVKIDEHVKNSPVSQVRNGGMLNNGFVSPTELTKSNEEIAIPQSQQSDFMITNRSSPKLDTSIDSQISQEISDDAESHTGEKWSKWSSILASPSSGELYSPSLDLNLKTSLHGRGLKAAVERAKRLSKGGKRCSSFFLELSSIHEAYANSILKSCYIIVPNDTSEPPKCLNKISKMVTEVNSCLISFAKQTQGLAICIKGSIARPLYSSSSVNDDTVPSIFERYTLTRVKSYNSRQLANNWRNKYINSANASSRAIKELQGTKRNSDAESTAVPSSDLSNSYMQESDGMQGDNKIPTSPIDQLKKIGSIDETDEGKLTWNRMATIVTKKYGSKNAEKTVAALKATQRYENQYIRLLAEENQEVSRSETMEKMALEALQELEEERLFFFFETLGRFLQAEKGALDNMSLLLRRYSEEVFLNNEKNTTLPPEITRGDSKLLDTNFASSVQEALSLSLPEVVGNWRDIQKKMVLSKSANHQAAKLLSAFTEELSTASRVFANSLFSLLASEGYNSSRPVKGTDNLKSFLEKHECPRTLKNWEQVIQTLEDCCNSASNLANILYSDCNKKLGPNIRSGEKELKNYTDAAEMRWKHVCDAARAEMKTNAKYNQSKAELEKAKERMASIENNRYSETQQGNQQESFNPTMSKALGNMFSMLPNASEEAMTKILSPEQRKAVAASALANAISKENKDSLAHISTTEAKKLAIEAYVASSQKCYEQDSREEKIFWRMIKDVCAGTIESFQRFQRHRYDCNRAAIDFVKGKNSEKINTDIFQWTKEKWHYIDTMCQDIIEKEGKKEKSNNSISDGFKLEICLVDPKKIGTFVKLVNDDNLEPSEKSDIESTTIESKIDSHTEKSDSDNCVDSDRASPVVSSLGKDLTDTLFEANHLKSKDTNDISFDDSEAPNSVPASPSKKHIEEAVKPKIPLADPQTSVFLAHFWDSKGENESTSPPTVIDSFSCAYWPKEEERHFSPLLHGRMFCTSSTMYFVGWGDKKIVLNWEDVISITKETTAYGTVPNALLLKYESEEGKSSYFFGSFAFRENAFQLLQRLSSVARSLSQFKPKTNVGKKSLPKVPPDQALKKMEVIFTKKIKKMQIRRFYELCWSEGFNTDGNSFYQPFLDSEGCFDIKVPNWETCSTDSSSFFHKFSEEKYEQRRVVQFKFNRTTHLYVGPPVAVVNQTHHIRIEDNDKCVLVMTTEIDGIPYADCFAVEVRWVARREGNHDLKIEVGLAVDFKKSCMWSKQIKSGTITETKPFHERLFDQCKMLCDANAIETGSSDENSDEEADGESDFENGTENAAVITSVAGDSWLGYICDHLLNIWRIIEFPKDTSIPVISDFSLNLKLSEKSTATLLVLVVTFIFLFFIVTSNKWKSEVTRNDIELLTDQIMILNEEMRGIRQLLSIMVEDIKEQKI